MSRFVILFALALTVTSLVGCGRPIRSQPAKTDSDSAPAKETVVVDRLGREVRFTTVPQRIVSLSPATTELLFAIGAGPSIVGATRHCDYPPPACEITRVGGGTLEGISREMIIGLEPDLVLCKWDSHEPLVDVFERVNIPVVAIGPESLEELFDEATLLGRVTGQESNSRELIERMSQRLTVLTSWVDKMPRADRRTVFYEVWDEPLMTAGPGSFIGELLEIGGMENIFADTTLRYPRISSEVVVDRSPDVILAPSTHSTRVNLEQLVARPGWGQLKAVRERQVFLIDGDQVSRCGPRLLDALEQMIRAVYPEQLPAIPIEAEPPIEERER